MEKREGEEKGEREWRRKEKEGRRNWERIKGKMEEGSLSSPKKERVSRTKFINTWSLSQSLLLKEIGDYGWEEQRYIIDLTDE